MDKFDMNITSYRNRPINIDVIIHFKLIWISLRSFPFRLLDLRQPAVIPFDIRVSR